MALVLLHQHPDRGGGPLDYAGASSRKPRAGASPVEALERAARAVRGPARSIPLEESRLFEIGGADQASYANIMLEYARQRGLKRRLIPVPVLTPRLSGLWLGLVTPLYASVGRKLVESLKHDTVVQDDSASRVFQVRPRGLREAVARSLRNEDRDFAETSWSDALSSYGGAKSWGGIHFGSRLVDSRTVTVDADCESAFAPVRRIGGERGWYYGNFLWQMRGFLDILAGGPGLRRGRRDPEEVRQGEALDFWRVEYYERPHRMRLQAEMKVPGRAWLQFEVQAANGGARIRQTAEFDPLGLFGLLYWYALWPLHELVFAVMVREIARRAEREAERSAGRRRNPRDEILDPLA